MSLVYRSGRSRTLKLVMNVTVGGSWPVGPFGGSSPGQTLAAGSTYTTVQAATPANDRGFSGFSSGLGVFAAFGTKGSSIGGDLNSCIGVVVPSLTGNGFVPLVLLTAGNVATFSVSVTLTRNLPLLETFGHSNNGQRWDVYASGCSETYVVHAPSGDVTFTSGGASQFVPGQTAGWEAFGINAPTIGGRGFVAYSKAGGAAAAVTWSGGFVDSHGDPIFSDPAVPTNTGTGGSTRWGRVATRVPLTSGIATNIAQATIQWMPTHAFNVRTEPRALPDGRPLTQQHRVEYELVSPIGGSGASSGYTLYSSGETISFVCGGAKWLASLTGEGSYSTTFDAFLPVLSRVKVTHNDAARHYFCQVRAPFAALSLAQAQTLMLSGTTGLNVASGSTQTVSFGEWIGYRFLRIVAYSVGGTGTLTIAARLNGDSSDTESVTLTTTAAGESVQVELDLVETPGNTSAAALTLDSLRFTASGTAFVVSYVQAFVKYSSRVVSCGLRRALYSSASPGSLPTEPTPWLQGYTDGVLSLQAPSFTTDSPVAWWSQTVRQLVEEINGDSLHDYGSWSAAEPLTWVDAAGSPPAPSGLTGWSATLSSPPSGSKGYAADEDYTNAQWIDGDVYTSALHGDGLIAGATLLGEELS